MSFTINTGSSIALNLIKIIRKTYNISDSIFNPQRSQNLKYATPMVIMLGSSIWTMLVNHTDNVNDPMKNLELT